MEKGRAYRRAQIERLKENRKHYWGDSLNTGRRHGMAVTTPAPCSCWMCGNDRKYRGERTIQERRQMQVLD